MQALEVSTMKTRKFAIYEDYLDYLTLALLVTMSLLIRFGFLSLYDNFILHEDSGPYIDEAERLIEGRETTNGLPGRPLGYPLFLIATIKLFSNDLLVTVALQHLLSIAGVLLLTLSLRMLGANRLLSYVFFVAVANAHRLMHYDNTIGAETLTLFLMSVTFFALCGMYMRRWNPWAMGVVIGAVCAYMLLVRSATFFIPLLAAMSVMLPVSKTILPKLRQRLALMMFIALPTIMTGIGMTQWNKAHYGRAALSREVEPNMAFTIAYAGDMTRGAYPELRRELLPIVQAGRATLKDDGYSTVENYQWVYRIFDVLSLDRLGSQQEKDRVVSSLFWDTLLTPRTLYQHLVEDTLREMRFMLFDQTPVANSVLHPIFYSGFVMRDSKPLRIAVVRNDRPPGVLLSQVLPGFIGEPLQDYLNHMILNNYVNEYMRRPGLMWVYTILSLVFLAALLFELIRGWKIAHWIGNKTGLLSRLPTSARQKLREHPKTGESSPDRQIAFLATGYWLGSAFVACFLVYALHRYSYYVLPFNAFTAFYALSLVRGGARLDGKNKTNP